MRLRRVGEEEEEEKEEEEVGFSLRHNSKTYLDFTSSSRPHL